MHPCPLVCEFSLTSPQPRILPITHVAKHVGYPINPIAVKGLLAHALAL